MNELLKSGWFQLAYWMFIGGISIALTGFIFGMIVLIAWERR